MKSKAAQVFCVMLGTFLLLTACGQALSNPDERPEETNGIASTDNNLEKDSSNPIAGAKTFDNGPDDWPREFPPDDTFTVFSPDITGLGEPCGIAVLESGILVSDMENNCLVLLDPETGVPLQQIGGLGAAPLEFTSPRDLFWHQEQQVLYVLDSGNNRVQKLNAGLEFMEQIYLPFVESGEFTHIAVDDDGNLYASTDGINLDACIYFIPADGSEAEMSTRQFTGSLCVYNGTVYAANSYELEGTTRQNGYSYLYRLDGAKMERIAQFPFKYTPGAFILEGDTVYTASTLFNMAEVLEISGEEIVYEKTLAPQFPWGYNSRYSIALQDNMLWVALTMNGDLYKLPI